MSEMKWLSSQNLGFHIGDVYNTVGVNVRSGTIRHYDAVRGHSNDIPFADFAKWAHAGGKAAEAQLTEEQKALITKGNMYDSVCDILSIPYGGIFQHISNLNSHIADLERQLAAAKATPPKPEPPPRVRCIDCENLDMSTVKDGYGECPLWERTGGDVNIYINWSCKWGYTPATKGCGNADQALRAELARVTKDKGGK